MLLFLQSSKCENSIPKMMITNIIETKNFTFELNFFAIPISLSLSACFSESAGYKLKLWYLPSIEMICKTRNVAKLFIEVISNYIKALQQFRWCDMHTFILTVLREATLTKDLYDFFFNTLIFWATATF